MNDQSVDFLIDLILEWEDAYNRLRPHPSLNHKTPLEAVEE